MTVALNPQNARQLLQLLEQDKQVSQRLIALLSEERAALEKRDYSRYHELIEQKKEVLLSLDKVDRDRRVLMESMGYSVDKDGMEALISQLPAAWQARFQTLWSELTSNLATCRHLNEVNGRILNHAQQAIERLMSFLRGVSPQQSIYNRQGKKGLLAGNRSLAMA